MTASQAALDVVVDQRQALACGVLGLTLVAPDGTTLPAWRPGAHIDLLLSNDMVRQYSLCGNPENTSKWAIAVQLEDQGRGGSRWIHENLPVGSTIRVSPPRNLFELAPADEYVFIAGGIGITPITAMVRTVRKMGTSWRLLYGGRTRSTMAFRDEFADDERVSILPQDEHGLLDLDRVLLPVADRAPAVYACGPEPLLAAVEDCCARFGMKPPRVERFSPRPDVTAGAARSSFEVLLAQSGLTVTVPADKSILDVLEEQGQMVLSSCREGTCGSCETTLLHGDAQHLDSVQTEQERLEGNTIYICVSRARSQRLVLDL